MALIKATFFFILETGSVLIVKTPILETTTNFYFYFTIFENYSQHFNNFGASKSVISSNFWNRKQHFFTQILLFTNFGTYYNTEAIFLKSIKTTAIFY